MIRAGLNLLLAKENRHSLLAFCLCAIVAVVGGLLTPPPIAEQLIVRGGYYYIFGVFSLWIYFGLRIAAPHREKIVSMVRRPNRVGLFLVAATGFTIWTDSFAHKILFDEYVLQG